MRYDNKVNTYSPLRACDLENAPVVIHNYARLIYTVVFLILFLFIAITFVWQVRQDLQMKMQTENEALHLEIQKCT